MVALDSLKIELNNKKEVLKEISNTLDISNKNNRIE